MSSDDILRPQLIVVGGSCYRVNPIAEKPSGYQDDYIDDDESFDRSDEVEDEYEEIDMEKSALGYSLVMDDVPAILIGYVLGKKAETKRRIEAETKARIYIPSDKGGATVSKITIEGEKRQHVASAKMRIEMLLDTSRQSKPPTHFLSIPITSEEATTQFTEFQEVLLAAHQEDRGVHSSIFQKKDKLHLTLGMLVLLTEKEVKAAVKVLQSCKALITDLLGTLRLKIQLKGLEYMNDDATSVDVLYIKVQESQEEAMLQEICRLLIDNFVAAGIMVKNPEREAIKLHVTAMNTKYRDKTERHNNTREKFDASGILHNFSQFDFGSQLVDTIHLSAMRSQGGYYDCEEEIHF